MSRVLHSGNLYYCCSAEQAGFSLTTTISLTITAAFSVLAGCSVQNNTGKLLSISSSKRAQESEI